MHRAAGQETACGSVPLHRCHRARGVPRLFLRTRGGFRVVRAEWRDLCFPAAQEPQTQCRGPERALTAAQRHSFAPFWVVWLWRPTRSSNVWAKGNGPSASCDWCTSRSLFEVANLILKLKKLKNNVKEERFQNNCKIIVPAKTKAARREAGADVGRARPRHNGDRGGKTAILTVASDTGGAKRPAVVGRGRPRRNR